MIYINVTVFHIGLYPGYNNNRKSEKDIYLLFIKYSHNVYSVQNIEIYYFNIKHSLLLYLLFFFTKLLNNLKNDKLYIQSKRFISTSEYTFKIEKKSQFFHCSDNNIKSDCGTFIRKFKPSAII